MNATNDASQTDAHHKKVLIIEDEEMASDGYLGELHKRGIDADVSNNFADAVNKLGRCAYQVVILDLALQNAFAKDNFSCDDSMELLRRIRGGKFAAGGVPADVPIIVCTCVTESSVMEEVKRAKPEGIYTKPESPFVLAEHVKILLAKEDKL